MNFLWSLSSSVQRFFQERDVKTLMLMTESTLKVAKSTQHLHKFIKIEEVNFLVYFE